jgi:hypothetical protein
MGRADQAGNTKSGRFSQAHPAVATGRQLKSFREQLRTDCRESGLHRAEKLREDGELRLQKVKV